jgi:hypothetical protein
LSNATRALPSPPAILEEEEEVEVNVSEEKPEKPTSPPRSHLEPRDVAASLEKVKDVSITSMSSVSVAPRAAIGVG